MLAAEALGYRSVWIAEHHFNDYGLCPLRSPGIVRRGPYHHFASRHGVSLLPLHHPVDLAEELAVLDVVSGGRLDVGIGRGGTLQDYQTFQSDAMTAGPGWRKGSPLMRQSWSGAPFDFQGQFHSAAGVHVRPRPVQRPHPPLFIAPTARTAVALGGPPGPAYAVVILRVAGRAPAAAHLYREVARAAGRREEEVEDLQRRSWGMRVVHVAPDHAEALRATEAPFMGYQRKMSVLALRSHRRDRAELVRPLAPAPALLP